jgi:hypothetical protein
MAGGLGGKRGVGGEIAGGETATRSCVRASGVACGHWTVRWWRRWASRSRRGFRAVCHVSCHRSWQTPLRTAPMGCTCVRSHRIPVSVRRASTTSVVARSSISEPRGQEAASNGGVLHHGTTRAYLSEMVSTVFSFPVRVARTIGQRRERAWPTMGEHRHTAVEQRRRPRHPVRVQSLTQRGTVRCGVRTIHKTHGICAMDLRTGWHPLGSIPHRTPLCGLDHLASAGLDVRQIRTVGSVAHARNRGQVPDVDRLHVGRRSRNVPDRQGADVCPRSSRHRDHRPRAI